MIFDVVGGVVMVGGKALRGGSSFDDTVAEGFAYERVVDMKTGWVFRTSSRDLLGTHAVTPALGFLNDQLKRVSVTFLDDETGLQRPLAERHRDFLLQELGVPSKTTAAQTLYEYPWGQIAAEQDIRSDTSYIIVTWK